MSGPYREEDGGEIGIRTLDTVPRIPDFESGAFDHSAISPGTADYTGNPEPTENAPGVASRRVDAGVSHKCEGRVTPPFACCVRVDALYFFAGAPFAGLAGGATTAGGASDAGPICGAGTCLPLAFASAK